MQRVALMIGAILVVIGMVGLPANRTTQAQSERLAVVATYSILGDVIAQVAGDAADVDVLMPLGADPHSYAPSGADLALLEEADVVFSNGVGFEGGLTEILDNGDINHVIASMCVPIWDFEATYGGHDHEGEEGEEHEGEEHEGEEHEGEEHEHSAEYEAVEALCETHFSEIAAVRGETPAYWEGTLGPLYTLECGGHSHEGEAHEGEAHAEGEEGEEAGHSHGNCDPHVWLDPYNGWLWALMARDTLSELDPANAAVYAANAEAWIAALGSAIDEMNALYASIPDDQNVLIANHRVMGYIANPLGFEAVFAVIPGGSTAAEPSAQDIVELVEVIQDEGVRAIYSEVTIADNVVARIGEEAGAEVVRLYTESLSEADGPAPTYIDMVLFNAVAISESLAE